MQTFLPYPDFNKSAQCLDNKRLNKQRVECLQILECLKTGAYQSRETIVHEWRSCSKEEYDNSPKINVRKTPWYNHPAVQMWKNYESYLMIYGRIICKEWIARGFRDSCYEKIYNFHDKFKVSVDGPNWLGNERLHSSHRAALLAKNNQWYSQFNWAEKPEINYIWPTKIS